MTSDPMRGLLIYTAVAGILAILSTTSVIATEPLEGPVVWISGLALLASSVAAPVAMAIHQHLRHRSPPGASRHRPTV
jgi:hypothetical protein